MLRRSNITIATGWEEWLREHGLGGVKGVYQFQHGEIITRSGTVEVRRVRLGTRTVFIKKYWANRFSQLWSGMLRGSFLGRSKARREYDNLLRMRSWQLDAPAPVAFGEERRGGWLIRSFLISEAVPEAVPLHVFIRDQLPAAPTSPAPAQRHELVEQLALYTRRLHEHHFVHHDYFWRNILLSGHSLKHFFLIDAHKGRPWFPWEERRARAMDLAALDSPAPHFFRRAERLRFFLLYRNHRKLDAGDKSLLRLVLRLAEPLRERQLRRALGLGRETPRSIATSGAAGGSA